MGLDSYKARAVTGTQKKLVFGFGLSSEKKTKSKTKSRPKKTQNPDPKYQCFGFK